MLVWGGVLGGFIHVFFPHPCSFLTWFHFYYFINNSPKSYSIVLKCWVLLHNFSTSKWVLQKKAKTVLTRQMEIKLLSSISISVQTVLIVCWKLLLWLWYPLIQHKSSLPLQVAVLVPSCAWFWHKCSSSSLSQKRLFLFSSSLGFASWDCLTMIWNS